MAYCYYCFALLKYLYLRVFRRKGHRAFSEVLCHRCGAGLAVLLGLIIPWGSGRLQADGRTIER